MEQQDLLLDLETEILIEPASVGARFANYVIDLISCWLFTIILSATIALFFLENNSPYTSYKNSNPPFYIDYLVRSITIVIYYTLIEGLFKGRTLGKLFTGTKAVKEDGSPITWKDALLRSLCRLVPFEPFSAFGGQPWHDKWTKTVVIKK